MINIKVDSTQALKTNKTRRFSNHESHLLSQAHTFAIIVTLDLKIHQSMWIHWSFFPKTWTKGHWPLHDLWPPCLLRSHVWLYPRIIVSKSHDNTSMYVDTVINFANYHIHTHTTYIHTYYILHTTYRMSDHIVSYWTQFRRDKNAYFNCDQKCQNIEKISEHSVFWNWFW